MFVCLVLPEYCGKTNKNKQELGRNVKYHKAILLLGGNIGDVKSTFKAAEKALVHFGTITKGSSLYETAAWGMENAQPFLNKVIVLSTELEAEVLLLKILSIEEENGRTRYLDKGYSSRTLDIDILFYNEEIINNTELIVPHPRLHERRFTLEPLCEIMRLFTHPVLKKTMGDLKLDLNDGLEVKRFDE